MSEEQQRSILDDLKQARTEIAQQLGGGVPPVPQEVSQYEKSLAVAPDETGKIIEDNLPKEGEVELPKQAAPAPVAPPKEIRIGDQVFSSEGDAIKYAEQLEREKIIAEARAMGIQEALAATAKPPEPEVDNFEERFYSNPKETLKEVKAQATQEAIAIMKAEQTREKMWNDFFDQNPDLAGSRQLCEHVLQQNWEVLGKMTDIPRAMKILATKTRSLFDEYAARNKPRTELPNKAGQVVSTGSAAAPSVTPKEKVAPASDFMSELKAMRKR